MFIGGILFVGLYAPSLWAAAGIYFILAILSLGLGLIDHQDRRRRLDRR